ncbi:MAG TPA: N-methyl-L-tryptophan oxidase [Gemmatimonadaceae bacterium]|nr:N-methyl-L-tryptophan oxidase [Gemmatimonadaceae bacterium]
MAHTTDVIVVGLGAMGSAALYHLAQRGVRVIGFDRFAPPHTLGSTHGLSRIIRESYYEHPRYVPLVQRAYELWAELERRAARRLFYQTGGLMIGDEDGVLVAGALRSAREHGLAHEMLSAKEVRSRFPAFTLPDQMNGFFEPRAGVLDPEGCVDAHLQLAAAAGAEVRANEPIREWSVRAGRVRVVTELGSYDAARMALCAGAWNPALIDDDSITLRVERQVMHWFTPARTPELFAPERCPIAMTEYAPDRIFYFVPDSGDGVKAAIHHEGEVTDPDAIRREVADEDVAPVTDLLRRYLPNAAGALRGSATCLYTNTTDGHFLLAPHARHEEVLIVSACSGHGFKFASAIGEAVADLTMSLPRPDLIPFGRQRPVMNQPGPFGIIDSR